MQLQKQIIFYGVAEIGDGHSNDVSERFKITTSS